MESPLLLSDRHGAVLTLTMNRPERRNALSGALVSRLRAALEDAARDESVRVVVLTGAGKAFSAGADLDALRRMQSATSEDNLTDSAHLAGLFREIYLHPKPVIANVNGHAIGGGCGLVSVCDLSVVAEEAKLGFTEVRLGFVPAIVMVFALRKLGETRVRDLMLRGHLISGAEAAEIGLATRAVPDGALNETVAALASEIATETSPAAIALTKSMLARVAGMGLDEALHHATLTNALARTTGDFKAGIASFLDKTAPPWKARDQDPGARDQHP